MIDLRTLVPLDNEMIAQSVAKTGRLLVVDEDYLSFGVSGEIVARVIEGLGGAALNQVIRHALPDVPIPAAKTLEDVVLPTPDSIASILRQMAARS